MPKNLDTLSHAEIVENLDRQIAVLQYQLERLQTIRWAIEDPGTFDRLGLAMSHTWDEVVEKYAGEMGNQEQQLGPSGKTARRPTRFERIVSHFRTSGNEWATTKEIARGIGVTDKVIQDVLYKTHKDEFERQKNPEGRGKVFRLKESDSP